MFKAAFSGFSVNNLEKAKEFYTNTLGLQITHETMGDGEDMGLTLKLPNNSGKVFAYPKEDHVPAAFTVLNFVVENIDEAVAQLTTKGVTFEHYEGMPHDDKWIVRGLLNNMGPDIAWFKDPAGNILSVLQEK